MDTNQTIAVGYKSLINVEFTDNGLKCHFRNHMTGENFSHVFPSEHLKIDDIADWVFRSNIQDAMPNLTSEEREWFLSGIRN